MDLKPLNRSKWQAGLVFAISLLIALYYPQYIVQIYEYVGLIVAFIAARWAILWRKWVESGAPERRKTDLEGRIKKLESDFALYEVDRHKLRESMNKILGDVQIDIKELRADVKKAIDSLTFIENKVN